MATKKVNAIKSDELRKLMDSFLEDVIDIDDRKEFHFAFCSLLTYVVDQEMKGNSEVNTIQQEISELTDTLEQTKAKYYKVTEFK